MEEDSDEEMFSQVVAGKKELGLEFKVSRQAKSVFKYESQSQESNPTSVQVFTYEVKESGEMLLLNESDRAITTPSSLDQLQSPTSLHPDTSSEAGTSLLLVESYTPALSGEVPPQETLTVYQNSYDHQDTSSRSSLNLLYDQELTTSLSLNQFHSSASQHPITSSENTTEIELRLESESPVISNTYCAETEISNNSSHARESETSEVLLVSCPSTSRIESTQMNTTDDPDYDPEATSCSSDEESSSNYQQDSTRKYKRRKGLAEPESWKANINKKLRESGKNYIGWKRNENTCNKHNVPRSARQMKETCESTFCQLSKERHCNEFTQECRQRLFNLFWGLSWDQKKMFVINTTEKSKTSRPTAESSRRAASLQYYLKQGDVKLRVCKKMYLCTLDIGEWSVRKWVNESDSGMLTEPTTEQKEKKKRGDKKKLSRMFLVDFIENLPKLPSHYCRKDTSKVYLEPHPGGMLETYNTYKEASLEKDLEPLCRTMFDKIIREKNIGFQQPKKDLCDTCVSHLTNQISEEEFNEHQTRKKCARAEKDRDLKESVEGKCIVLEQDVQAVKICPYIKASSAYYRRKLINHNFTVYEYPSKKVRCYWFSEVNGDTQASVFVSCIVDYLTDMINHSENGFDAKPIIIWSDGCTYQNRNAILANALSNFAALNDVVIYHKYLEPGHTQMEVDSVHAAIERGIQKHSAIYVPSQYADITKSSRKNPYPYEVKSLMYDFFKKFDDPKVMQYESIRPGKKKGDPVVTDLKEIMYKPDGKIYFKTSFEDENYCVLPSRPKNIDFPVRTYENLFKEPLKLTSTKYSDLQALKSVIPADYHSFYDNLPHN